MSSLPFEAVPNGPPVSRWFGFFPEFQKNALGFLTECRRYGDVVKLPFGHLGEILLRQPDLALHVLNHPDDVKHVLVTNQHNYTKAPVPPVETRIFGHGLLHSEGTQHHGHRRLLMPFFHGDHIIAYADTITKKATDALTRWELGSTQDIGREMGQLTLSIIWSVLFGREIGTEANLIAESLVVGQRLVDKQYNSIFAQMTPLWFPTKIHRKFARHHEALDALVLQMIRERRSGSAGSKNVLSLLCVATEENGQVLSEQAIRDELVTLILAGHETTANALTWTWFLLAQFRTVRTRLAEELAEVLEGRLPTVADLPRLVYTRMVWDEVLRLYPPAWTLHMRLAGAEDTLPSGDRLPQGAYVFLSPWSIQRDPRWFPDPNRFDPERFSPDAQKIRPPFSYFPFGGGGRRCLGESFAELEGILVLATLASHIQLRLIDGQVIQPDALFTLRPKTPILMTVQPAATGTLRTAQR